MKKLHYGIAALAALALGGGAIAQIPIPMLNYVSPNDIFQDVVGGYPQAQSFYVTAAQISGTPGYFLVAGGADEHGVAITYTATAGVSNIIAYATTSAITSATITTEAHPGDGQRECYLASGEATTTLTWTPNTGQTLNTSVSPSAGVSNVPYCITYVAAQAKWYRSN